LALAACGLLLVAVILQPARVVNQGPYTLGP